MSRDFVISLEGLGKDLAWHAELSAVCPKCKAGKMPIESLQGGGTSLVCGSCGHTESLKAEPDEIVAKIIGRMQQLHQVKKTKKPTGVPYL